VGIEDRSHWEQPLTNSLSPEPRSLETVGQGHHNGPKLVFDILLEGKDCSSVEQPPAHAWPFPRPQTDPGQIVKLRKKFREMKDRGGELSEEEGETTVGTEGNPGFRALRTRLFISGEDRT
jgi:hypothetical protein